MLVVDAARCLWGRSLGTQDCREVEYDYQATGHTQDDIAHRVDNGWLKGGQSCQISLLHRMDGMAQKSDGPLSVHRQASRRDDTQSYPPYDTFSLLPVLLTPEGADEVSPLVVWTLDPRHETSLVEDLADLREVAVVA